MEWIQWSEFDRVQWTELDDLSLVEWAWIESASSWIGCVKASFLFPGPVPRQHLVALLACAKWWLIDGVVWCGLVGNQASISQGCSMGGTGVIAASDIPCYRKKLKLIWKCFEWKHVKETRPGHITNNQTEVKQATSTQRKASSYLWYPLMCVESKPKSPTHPIQARPELPRDQSHWVPNSCPARSYWSSRLPREPERTQDIKDPGQQLQQVKWVKRLGEARCKGNMGKGAKVALSGVSQVVSWMEWAGRSEIGEVC